MTREQESDSTLSPEKEEGGVETPVSQGQKEDKDISAHRMVVCIATSDNTKRSDVFLLWRQYP